MNIYAPPNAKTKWKAWDFIGKIKTSKSGKKYIKAKHTFLPFIWYYVFELDEMTDTIP